MRSYLVILLFLPFSSFSQEELESNRTIQKIDSLRSLSKLDSISRNVKHFSTWFDTINSWRERSPWLYIYQDTIFFEGKFGVGSIILDPNSEFSGVRHGLWRTYYSNGNLFSVGTYSVAARIYCTPVGPVIEGYSYRIGKWKYLHEGGENMASGTFKIKKVPYGVCEGDYELVSRTTRKWKFYHSNKSGGDKVPPTGMAIEQSYW